jgi:hypothetical protein
MFSFLKPSAFEQRDRDRRRSNVAARLFADN